MLRCIALSSVCVVSWLCVLCGVSVGCVRACYKWECVSVLECERVVDGALAYQRVSVIVGSVCAFGGRVRVWLLFERVSV